MIRALVLAALAAAPALAKEKDDYAPLKPLLGKWDVARECDRGYKDKIYVEIVRLNNAVRASYYDTPKKLKGLGKSEVFFYPAAERFKVFTYIPQVMQLLGGQPIPGTIAVAGSEAEVPGLVTANAHYSVVDGNLRLKLKDKNTKATFTVNGKSPLGAMNCTGAGVKIGEFAAATPAAGPPYKAPAKRAATAND